MSMKVAIYFRVSTDHQDFKSQEEKINDFISSKGYEVVCQYEDKISGTKFDRKGLNKLLKDARTQKWDAVIIYNLSRLGRSIVQVLQVIEELKNYQKGVHSVCENISTLDDNPFQTLTISIISAINQISVEMLRINVKEGVKRAIADRGIENWGRPKVAFDLKALIDGRRNKESWRSLSRRLKVSTGTLIRRYDDIKGYHEDLSVPKT